MPWQTPTLTELRTLNRNNVVAQLRSVPLIQNSGLRITADANAGLAYLALLYLDWLARQLLPDTAEGPWLDRHANIWIGGRKQAAFASGSITVTGIPGYPVPSGTILNGTAIDGSQVQFQITAQITVGSGATPANVAALTPGAVGNLAPGSPIAFNASVPGVDGGATVVALAGGVDQETDDELRVRVLDRIQEPPMGGDADDYVQWALKVPGVTRAWLSPKEMGIGTVTLRFMMDDLRATSNPLTNGFPTSDDVAFVAAYIDTVRPVAVKDRYIVAPIPEPISFTITDLSGDDASLRAAIANSVTAMLATMAKPAYALNGVGQSAQTIYSAWVSDAIYNTAGVDYFDLTMSDHVMPTNGSLAVLGTIT